MNLRATRRRVLRSIVHRLRNGFIGDGDVINCDRIFNVKSVDILILTNL